ncbi:PAS domain S-box protein, partial [Candidatus Bipolaricaulota bacterium]|nr:PAS domain S-box protein [Candidatus Bipolaricaulota bacterium]
PEALFVEDLERNILDVNTEACELLGYEKGELLEQGLDKIVPEDRPVFPPDRIVEATRSGNSIETVNLHKNGNEIPVELRGRIIEVGGRERILVSVNDISGRKVAEEKFRKLFDQGPEPAVFLDGNSRIMDVNSRFEEVFNYKLKEVKGENVNNVIVPDRLKEEARKLDKDAKQGYMNYETVRQGKNREFPVSISANPVSVGDETFVLGIYRDITERVESKQALEKSEKTLKQIFNNANDAIYLHELTDDGLPGQFIEVNDVACQMLGYNRDEFLETSPRDINAGVRSEDGPAIMEELLSEGHNTFEMVHETKDGRSVPVEVSSHAFEMNGETRVLSVVRDITERKELQRRQELISHSLDQASLQVYWMRPDGRFVYTNEKVKDKLGYTEEELKDMYVWDIDSNPEHSKDKREERWQLLKKEGVLHFESTLRTKDGDTFPVEIKNHHVEFTGEEYEFVFAEDITERKEAEEALQEERDKLKDLHSAVDRLQSQESEKDLAQTAVEMAKEMLGFDLCALAFLKGDKLVPRANSSDLDPNDTKTYEIGEGIAGRTFQEGETICGDDVRDHPDAKPTKDEWKAFISVPVGEVGVLQVISDEKGSFDQRDVRLTEILTDHLNEEVQRIRLEEELRQQAIRDPLTGLYNRRYFNESLGKEVERCRRYEESLAFLMMDVNRFKEVNDRYTHQTGDEVLQEVANLLQSNVRDADTVIRYGGDEFLIMMPETRKVDSTVNRIKEQLKQWNEESDLLDFPLKLAMGTAQWSPDQERGAEETLKEADRKMYEEKDR